MTIPKKFIFSLTTLFFAAMLIFGVEISVEKIFPELQPQFLSEVTYDQIEWYQINRSFLKDYFPSNEKLVPEFKPSLARKQKTKNTFRILCIGESSMFGVPYQMTANIPGMVRRQLHHLYPEKEIEVINLGASAINTNVILHLTKEFLRLQPDLVLIYTGHNEFYGPDGIGASWLEKMIPIITQWKYNIRNLSTIRLVQSFGSSTSQTKSLEENLMKQVSNGALVKLNSNDAQLVFDNFERNLAEIIKAYRQFNIPVIVSDVTSNLQFSPFVYDSTYANEYSEIRSLTAAKKYDTALNKFNSLDQIDSSNAYQQFLLGSIYLGLNDFTNARSCFESARDNDLLKFRAPGKINSIIKNVCAKNAIPFFSSDSIFQLHSINGITDTTFFWEHLHPKANGYYLIANGFVEKIQQENIFPSLPNAKKLPYNDDSLYISWLDRAFADVSMKNLTSKWPFVNFSVPQHFYVKADPVLKKIVDDVYAVGKVWDEGCYETAQLFWSRGNIDGAITTYRAVIEEYPYNFYAHYLLANALSQTGNIDQAIRHYTISMNSNPQYPFPKLDLGLIKINKGEFDEAIKVLSEALLIAQKEQLV
ncbi:MAG TPA: hypothetical protein DCQ28_07455, partial [Bacteroidetes bacterium]|nr:hypothetical protein [Bacteroidota bacterium]